MCAVSANDKIFVCPLDDRVGASVVRHERRLESLDSCENMFSLHNAWQGRVGVVCAEVVLGRRCLELSKSVLYASQDLARLMTRVSRRVEEGPRQAGRGT